MPGYCYLFFRCVTHEWMSSVFELLFLFWFIVMSLLSSLDQMDVPVIFLAYDVWAAEDNKTGFLSVWVDSFDLLYLEKRTISLLMVQISTIKKMINEDKWESSTNRNMRFFWWIIKILCLVLPPLWKTRKIKKCQSTNFDECSNIYFSIPLYT